MQSHKKKSFHKTHQKGIVLIAKDALEGKVKTRLAKHIGHQKACEIYRIMAQHICHIAVQSGYPVAISFQGDLKSPFAESLRGLGADLYQQPMGSLGKIIYEALHRFTRTVALGMDMPLLKVEHLHQAFSQNDICIGPAEDGGYWCIAATHPPKELFENIDWSTEYVLEQTLAQIKKTQIKKYAHPVFFLETQYDIDTYDDLVRLLTHPSLPPSLHKRITAYA